MRPLLVSSKQSVKAKGSCTAVAWSKITVEITARRFESMNSRAKGRELDNEARMQSVWHEGAVVARANAAQMVKSPVCEGDD